MNWSRIAMAAVVAWIVDAVYGFCVYGTLLKSTFERYPGVFRPMDAQMPFMPYLFLGTLIACFAGAAIYAKGYEGGSGVAEGARFGVWVGILMAGYAAIVGYATMNVGRRFTGEMILAGLVEWIIIGVVIGALYKPASK